MKNIKSSEISILNVVLNKVRNIVTIEEIENYSVEYKILNLAKLYVRFIDCGLNDLNGKLTLNELKYMYASTNGVFYPILEIAFTADCFLCGLEEYEEYDDYEKSYADVLGVNVEELVSKLKKEHSISIFALLSMLHKAKIDGEYNNFENYLKQYLQLKE